MPHWAFDGLVRSLSMVLPNYIRLSLQKALLISLCSVFVTTAAYGQGAPTPGGLVPPPGSGPSSAAAGYAKLPLNPGTAEARLEEMRNLMATMRPKDFQDMVDSYCEWISDMADAHWKLSQAFAKADGAKGQAESEKQLCLKFGQLKRQGMLLKGEFLVRQHRYPEALGPLVDIVAAEPKTETGQRAYRLLQEIGFSDIVAPAPAAASAPAPAIPPTNPATSATALPSAKPQQGPVAKSAH